MEVATNAYIQTGMEVIYLFLFFYKDIYIFLCGVGLASFT